MTRRPGRPLEANTLSVSLERQLRNGHHWLRCQDWIIAFPWNVCHTDRVLVLPQRLPDMLPTSNQSDCRPAVFTVQKYHLLPCHYINWTGWLRKAVGQAIIVLDLSVVIQIPPLPCPLLFFGTPRPTSPCEGHDNKCYARTEISLANNLHHKKFWS